MYPQGDTVPPVVMPLQQWWTLPAAFQYSHALFLFMMTMLILVNMAHLKRGEKTTTKQFHSSLVMSVKYEKRIQSHLPQHVNKSLTDVLLPYLNIRTDL